MLSRLSAKTSQCPAKCPVSDFLDVQPRSVSVTFHLFLRLRTYLTMTDNDVEPLSLDQQEELSDEDYYDLDERILSIVQQCNKHEIRPARLAAELGISLEDACAELCGLLAAVGSGATFHFDNDQVMVFIFPSDFQRKARRYKRRQTMKECIRRSLVVLVKVIKVVTAFGLVLSLLIVSIAAMVGLIAAIIAMSRSGHGGGHHRAELVRRLQSMFYTMRQLLWCYAMFGGNFAGQDPFLQELAYDLALVTSVCCGNPGSLFLWMRASQLHNRRRRQRGWAPFNRNAAPSDMEGVALVQRGTWGRDEDESPSGSEQGDTYRGLLSVSVEFLFGPTPFVPGPSESEKWKLRGAVIVQRSSENTGNGVSLEELSPYVDSPPPSLDNQVGVVSEGLAIVSHFNGRPIAEDLAQPDARKARFVFPELLAESSTVIKYDELPDPDDGSWEYLFYSGDASAMWTRTSGRSSELPSSLQEKRYVLTKLEKNQFQQCVILGVLNFIGVFWLRQSLKPGGVLDVTSEAVRYAAAFLQRGLMPVLHFYSILFFILPIGRFILIVMLNIIREKRNRRRADFAHALKTLQHS